MSVRRNKTVYERIESKKEEIKLAQEKLEQLNVQLQNLIKEKDNLEMKKLFETMKKNGISLEDALKKLKK
jgi:hypothetical protein